MAKHCNMSLRSFHRRFREAYGVTPRKYLQLKRVEAVRRALGESRRSIAQILEDVGVSDVTSFRRVFQRELGQSPAEFRRQLGG
jgi:transcriptional regulator GlxA family with amidase domain